MPDFNEDRIKTKRRKKKDKQIEKFDLNGKYTSKSIRNRVERSLTKSAVPTITTPKHKK